MRESGEEIDKHSNSSQEGDSDTSLQSFISKLSKMTVLPSALKEPTSSDGNNEIRNPDEKKDETSKNPPQDTSSAQKVPVRGRTLVSAVPQREDSESPETDPDFQISTSSSSSHLTSTSWILDTGMISEAMIGSMLSGDGYDRDSSNEDVFEDAVERADVEGEVEDKDSGVAADSQEAESKTSGSGDESDYIIGEFHVHTNKISAEQAKVAAAVTMVILAAFWAWESRQATISRGS